LPGKTPAEAFDLYAKPLKAVLGCLTRETLLRTPIPDSEDQNGNALQRFFFVKSPVLLKDSGLAFDFSHYFRIVWNGETSTYRVKTISYTYEIEDEATRHEILAFHWEPDSPRSRVKTPHLHLGFALRDKSLPFHNKAHIPSGRVPVEDVVSFLISDLQVTPLNSDWSAVIAAARHSFMNQKTW
jgi:hypothetical protein